MTWSTVAVRDVARVVGGATPKTGVAEYWDGSINWATPKDLSNLDGKFIANTPRKLTDAGLRGCAAEVLPPNSVLFSSRAPIGHVAINTAPMATNQGFKSFILGPRLDAGFLLWWLDAHRDRLQALGTGATFKEVSKATVERIEIPLPPLEEQKRIAAILDQADALRRLRRRALDRLNTLGQAIFHEMFAPSKASAWPIVDLGQLATNRDGARIPLKKEDRAKRSGSIPYYGASGVIDHIDDSIFEGKHLLIGEDGANLLARSSPVAFIADGRFWVNNHAHVLQGNGKAELEYLRCYIEAIDLEPYITGSAQPKLNQKQLNRIPIVLPPLNLQSAFVAAIALASKERNRAAVACEKSEHLFTSLQHRAFRGEL